MTSTQTNPTRRSKTSFPVARRRARALALRVLYEVDLTGHKWREALSAHTEHFGRKNAELKFCEHCIEGVMLHKSKLDDIIHRLAPAWPVSQLPAIDRNVIRLALFELYYTAEVPPKVVINEAVELAKTYGGDASSQFVNGVVGAAYSEREDTLSPANNDPKSIIKESKES